MRLSILLSLSPLFSILVNGLHVSPSDSLARRDDRCEPLAEYCASRFLPVINEGAERRSPSPTTTGIAIHKVKKLRSFTNAERLKRRLPLKSPTRRSTSRRSVPSSVPKITKRGVLQVISDGAVLGYVSKNAFSSAQLRYQPSLQDAVTVTFDVEAASTSASGVQMKMEDVVGMSGFPLLGLIQGRDSANANIASDSFHYVYLGGIALPGTAPGSTPMAIGNSYTAATNLGRVAESDVWSINLITGDVTAHWVNENPPTPATILFSQGTALYGGGSSAAFLSRYPSPVITYTLKFVEILTPL